MHLHGHNPFSCAGPDCSRYMQMIWAETTEVGCGVTVCGNTSHFVCSYSVGGNLAGSYNLSRCFLPYEAASSLEASAQCTADRGTVDIDDACDASYLLPANALPADAVAEREAGPVGQRVIEGHDQHLRMIAHPQCNGFMLAGDPLRQ